MLRGDSTKANEELGWHHEVSFEELVAEMVEADLRYFKTPGATLAAGMLY